MWGAILGTVGSALMNKFLNDGSGEEQKQSHMLPVTQVEKSQAPQPGMQVGQAPKMGALKQQGPQASHTDAAFQKAMQRLMSSGGQGGMR